VEIPSKVIFLAKNGTFKVTILGVVCGAAVMAGWQKWGRGGRKMGEGFAVGIIFANFVALKTEPIAFCVTNG
jgi:predicted negative regulator of RcsB-dependent stress response